MNTTLALLTGLFVRLAIPFLVTALVVLALRKLDARWQAEAEKEHRVMTRDNEPCWKEQGLAMDEIKLRAAKSEQPCWQMHRLSNGYLREACLDCDVFISAPIPSSKHTTAHI
ncbi:MAG: hypothetical protein JNM55_07920 [Anaerolineales bacterium]|nr:hypothetical protein [Anaerolineales bacterium]